MPSMLLQGRFAPRTQWPRSVLAVLAGLALAAWGASARLGWTFDAVFPVLLGGSVLAALGLYYDVTRRSAQLASIGYYLALWLALIALADVLSYVAAGLGRPLYDAQLARIDAAIGFHWPAWNAYVHARPALYWTLALAYASGMVQIPGSILYFALRRKDSCNRELWWTSLLAMLVTVAGSALVPALGTFAYFHTDLELAVHLPHLEAVRAGGAAHFHDLKGIVTLPSYHTAQALLFMYAYRAQGRAFVAVVVLNLLMLLSTPSMGGHYLVDMLAGALVAALSIVLVRIAVTRAARAAADRPAGRS